MLLVVEVEDGLYSEVASELTDGAGGGNEAPAPTSLFSPKPKPYFGPSSVFFPCSVLSVDNS